MRTPKFNFVPERQLSQKSAAPLPTLVTVTKHGQLQFGSEYLYLNNLEGKMIRMFVELEKKVIGWSVIEGNTDLDVLGDCREVKKSVNGNASFGITKILKFLEMDMKETKRFEIKKYVSPLMEREVSYIELNPKLEE